MEREMKKGKKNTQPNWLWPLNCQ